MVDYACESNVPQVSTQIGPGETPDARCYQPLDDRTNVFVKELFLGSLCSTVSTCSGFIEKNIKLVAGYLVRWRLSTACSDGISEHCTIIGWP